MLFRSSAYISIGVVEHDEHGPSLFLEEAFRILKKDGIALISVPYINPLRRIKALLGSYYRGPTDLPFYQYAFSKTEFTQYLTSVGFQVIKCAQYGGYKGLVDEFAYINKLFDMPQGWRLRKWVMNSNFLNKVNGHMMMYVAVKR